MYNYEFAKYVYRIYVIRCYQKKLQKGMNTYQTNVAT